MSFKPTTSETAPGAISRPAGQRFHIALCITELDFGGAERCFVELATGLDPNRFAATVECLGPAPPGPGQKLVARLAAAGVRTRFYGGRGLRDAWSVLRQLRRGWRESRPDLVQTFLWHANVLGARAARQAGVRRIVTGIRVAEPGRSWRRPLERWAGRAARRHVAVSEDVARFARERIGLPAERIVVIPNGLAVEQYPAPAADAASLGISKGRRVLLFVGRLDALDQKGARQLVEHAPELLARVPAHDLLLVGEGPLKAKLQRRSAELGMAQRIHLAGWRDDLPSILTLAELLLVPSRWEGMPNVVLEAMASSRPVVAMQAGGIDELLGHEPRQIVPAGDWPAFIDRAAALAGDESLREELGHANRARVAAQFDLWQMIGRYEELYLELLES